MLLAPIEASVIPLPHQIRALGHAIEHDRVRYLLADEVGLGKTIEAGLVMRELKLRGLVRRTLVIAPKGLVTQWVAEMQTHFGEEFRLLVPSDFSAYRRIAREDNIWRVYDQVVTPLDSVKPLEGRRGWSRQRLDEYNRERFEDLIAAGWDLVIVDEAHRLAGSTDQVARYKLGKGLAGAAPYLLLLSATPHQGKTEAFHRLVSFLDEDAFPDVGSVTRERVQPFVIRNEKRRAIDAEGELGTAGMHNQVNQWANQQFMAGLFDVLFDHGFDVALTSDHGNIEAEGRGRPSEGAVADLQGKRARVYPDQLLRSRVKERFSHALEWPALGLPEDYWALLAPGRSAFVREGERTVGHGGISIEEVVVPMVQIERLAK